MISSGPSYLSVHNVDPDEQVVFKCFGQKHLDKPRHVQKHAILHCDRSKQMETRIRTRCRQSGMLSYAENHQGSVARNIPWSCISLISILRFHLSFLSSTMSISVDDLVSSLGASHVSQEAMDLATLQVFLIVSFLSFQLMSSASPSWLKRS